MARPGKPASRGSLHYRNRKNPQTIDSDIKNITSAYADIVPSKIITFKDFPLSHKTQQGLKEAGFTKPTEIQREAIGFALQGHDVLGAAKTGSGKTLAFLIPVLERLFCEKWSSIDGVGALIISPTRELAYQTFEALRQIGKRHDFSAGLIIGGKHLREEAERINRTNIVICTPGRLLQHMDQTINFNVDRLLMLVLDECDKILDLGFEATMNSIIANLPPERQTMLFSATQTKSVKDLARLSLREPVYVSVHENATHSTPAQLDQSYVVCELHDKVSLLWFFIKHHLKSKILVFIQSCKQVRYLYEAFKRLRPGVTLLCLHGAMQQLKRVSVYEQFCRKKHAVLFATDIASRGLDFPAVHWVIQLDCPEDANTYIHRVGRTARLEKDGESLLVLLPSEEEAMLELLSEKKVPINSIRVNPKRVGSIQGKLESQLAADPEFKEQAKRAFVSYLRSVFLMSNKKVFDVTKLQMDAFARSLGLAIAPRVRFLDKRMKQQGKAIANAAAAKAAPDIVEAAKSHGKEKAPGKAAVASTEEQSADDSHLSFALPENDNEEDDDVLFKVKREPMHGLLAEEPSDENDTTELAEAMPGRRNKKKTLTKAALAKKLAKKNIQINSKVVFNEEGEVLGPKKPADSDDDAGDDQPGVVGGIDVKKAMARLRRADEEDKKAFRERIKRKHQEERLKRKEQRRAKKSRLEDGTSTEGEPVAVLDTEGNFNVDELPDPYSSGDESQSDGDGRLRQSPAGKLLSRSQCGPQEEEEEKEESEDHGDDEDNESTRDFSRRGAQDSGHDDDPEGTEDSDDPEGTEDSDSDTDVEGEEESEGITDVGNTCLRADEETALRLLGAS